MKRPAVPLKTITTVAPAGQAVAQNYSHIRQLVCVLFIISSSIWLLYTGVRFRLQDPKASFLRKISKEIENTKMAYAASRGPYILKEVAKPTGLVIFLHGLGDTGHGWSLAFQEMREKNIRYVFPNADPMPVTMNHGFVMPSWFDIKTLNMSGKEDETGIKTAAEKVRNLMKEEQEKFGLRSDQVILGGFSMGGALALYTGLTHPEKLGGMILLSSWLPLRDNFLKNKDGFSLSKQLCPIFQGHGKFDHMVKEEYGRQTSEFLSKARGDSALTEYKTYEVEHSSNDEELDDVRNFIKNNLSAIAGGPSSRH